MTLLFAFFCSLFLSAAENALSPVVVTATRTAQTVDESLASVTVITREDIDNSQALTIPDILRGVPGLDITMGGLGKTASVFMRGTESDHVLVLVDGVKIGSATTGSVAFEHLPLSQIERIEIVRGPRSSLYGSEAIGGVIQIFTRQGKGKKPSITFSGGAGEDNTYQLTGGVSGTTKGTSYSLFAN
ncbi:MAG: TonB-dependent vitamin B12 receptor, partial [Candidatus Parabeggiatoa sp. nov. 1]